MATKVTDPLAVYGSLLPKAKVASVPRAQVKMVDTVLCSGGKVWKWLYTAPSGEVAEKVHADVESIHASFLQSALSVGSNVNKLMMLVRRTNGALQVLNVEQSVEFFRNFDNELQTVVAMQASADDVDVVDKYVHSRGGDRSIYRVAYQQPPTPAVGAATAKVSTGKQQASSTASVHAATISIVRFFEYLRPAETLDGGVASAQADIAPMKSTSPAVNSALEILVKKLVPYAEHNLRGRVVSAEIDCVFDEREQPYFLWPTEVRQPDNSRRRSLAKEGADGAAAAGTNSGSSTSLEQGSDGGYDAAHRRSSLTSVTGGGQIVAPIDLASAMDGLPALAGGVMFSTLDPSQREAEAAVLAQFSQLLDQSVGDGRRGRILLVEGDASTSLAATQALAAAGYAVTVVNEGPKALGLTRKTVYDCLLIGKRLPSLSGVEVTRMIRQREGTLANAARGLAATTPPPYLPIVVLTGDTSQDDLRLYMECGMDGCVAKPLDVLTLLNTMAAAIPNPPPSATHQAAAVAMASGSSSSSVIGGGDGTTTLPRQSPGSGGILPAIRSAQPSPNTAGPSMMITSGPDGGTPIREGGVGAAASLFADADVNAYLQQGSDTGSGLQQPSEMLQQSSVAGGGGSQLQQGSAYSAAGSGGGSSSKGGGASTTGPRRSSLSNASTKDSPYKQNQAASLKRSSVRRTSPGAKWRDSVNDSSSLASISAAAGGRSGIVVLPAGAAIPGIQPPTQTSGGGPTIAGGGISGVPTIPVSEDPDGGSLGVFQLDSATSMPYCVLGTPRPGVPLFHFVVIGDMFETYESYQILFRKTVAKLPGLRVLLFNYPGQAYTEWRRDVVLNNEYLSGCLQALLTYLGPSGTRQFDLDGGEAPFYLLGTGNGAMIANYFVSAYHAAYPNMRAVVNVNGYSYIDPHLAAVFHDCINVFSCTPPSRPDLPVYFFARFLFSSAYLQKVGAPLALNLHTAVFNPITLEGRTALCRGALSHVDVRQDIADLPLPFILVSSSADGFVKPLHTAALCEARGGETRSIKRALLERSRAVVVWLRAGHEVFQEARKPMVNLLEQLATGFHETNDVTFLPLSEEAALSNLHGTVTAASMLAGSPGSAAVAAGSTGTILAATQASRARAASMNATAASIAAAGASSAGRIGGSSSDGSDRPLEDRFLDSIMKTMRTGSVVQTSHFAGGGGSSGDGPYGHGRPAAQVQDIPEALHYEPEVPVEVAKADRLAKQAAGSKAGGGGKGRRAASQTRSGATAAPSSKSIEADLLLDPDMSRFESRDKQFAAARARGSASNASSVLQGGQQYSLPEVKEYMSWRVRRNRKRLARIEACATSIQHCWRSYLARTLVMRMRQQRACVDMQSWWRGILARRYVMQMRRELWAATTIQRCWRGYYGRILTERLREERRASVLIQKNWKSYRTRKFVNKVKALRAFAAIKIQALVRRWRAQKLVWRMRDQRNAATNIQRVYRGHLGRKRAVREREKFMFSKSQAQGIEFARQMLMEHKLHATKLQSEVSILSKEKLATEERVEALLNEIGSFEAGTQSLERQMMDLSRAEAEAAGTLDEHARTEIREAKIRLDREFSTMLSKIADRREQLSELEGKLQAVDRTRAAKREELKDLERKLVVLLEQQQAELQAIRTRQDRRQENMVEDAIVAVTSALQGRDPGAPGSQYGDVSGNAGLLTNGASTMGRRGSLTNSSSGGLLPALADGTKGLTTTTGGGGDRRSSMSRGAAGNTGAITSAAAGGGGGGPTAAESAAALGGPTPQQRAEAAALMSSTETMMKFGFMSMSLTYFSSLNMIKAMKQLGAANTALAGNPMLTMMGQMGAVAMAGGNPSAAAAAIGATHGVRSDVRGEVSLWTVADVGTWLESVCLGQYKDAFADAAIDGAFLCELTEEDMRNTLGIEHALHRKKLLSAILRLRAAEDAAKLAQVQASAGLDPAVASGGGAAGAGGDALQPYGMGTSSALATTTAGARRGSTTALSGPALRAATALHGTRVAVAATNPSGMIATQNLERAENDAAQRAAARDAGVLRLDELMSWVRHNKGKLVAEALTSVPDGRFDHAYVRDPYVPDVGSVYVDVLNGPAFHVNKADDKGNTLLTVAAQNGRMKIAQLLVRKGANPNHQNVQGNSPLHFAMAYRFHDLAAWLVDPDKGGGDDSILNQYGLSAYDGLGDGK